ncbi:hypothetical protein [Flavobacterium hungaricum]|uniref:Lipoprotein n=1 Tax=Flavobacterium hungaricum TaxID=2082725 RepID=A0ABR9TN19_9FLAO|nr:hypothetical protein [Flavobacterium hungaricum]MBE8726764.1 hypothetical protein [Flavobacterium hungaricum]
MKNINLKNIIIMAFLTSIFSCKEKENKVYIYQTEEFAVKERSMKFDLRDCSKILENFATKNTIKSNSIFTLDIIYEDNYIFKKNLEPYSLKTGKYNISGIWINGNTGELKEIKTEKNITIILDPSEHIPFVQKVIL